MTIQIFDALGREVRTLVARDFQAGSFAETWDARNNEGMPVTSGLYLVRMQAEGFTKARSFTLLR